MDRYLSIEEVTITANSIIRRYNGKHRISKLEQLSVKVSGAILCLEDEIADNTLNGNRTCNYSLIQKIALFNRKTVDIRNLILDTFTEHNDIQVDDSGLGTHEFEINRNICSSDKNSAIARLQLPYLSINNQEYQKPLSATTSNADNQAETTEMWLPSPFYSFLDDSIDESSNSKSLYDNGNSLSPFPSSSQILGNKMDIQSNTYKEIIESKIHPELEYYENKISEHEVDDHSIATINDNDAELRSETEFLAISLVSYIETRFGVLGLSLDSGLKVFYDSHPSSKEKIRIIGGMARFCEIHQDRVLLMITDTRKRIVYSRRLNQRINNNSNSNKTESRNNRQLDSQDTSNNDWKMVVSHKIHPETEYYENKISEHEVDDHSIATINDNDAELRSETEFLAISLVSYIETRFGVLGLSLDSGLKVFYDSHPSSKEKIRIIGGMARFCEIHQDRLIFVTIANTRKQIVYSRRMYQPTSNTSTSMNNNHESQSRNTNNTTNTNTNKTSPSSQRSQSTESDWKVVIPNKNTSNRLKQQLLREFALSLNLYITTQAYGGSVNSKGSIPTSSLKKSFFCCYFPTTILEPTSTYYIEGLTILEICGGEEYGLHNLVESHLDLFHRLQEGEKGTFLINRKSSHNLSINANYPIKKKNLPSNAMIMSLNMIRNIILS